MDAALTAAVGTAAGIIASRRIVVPADWHAQDLDAAAAVEMIAEACEGNGDAYNILMTAAADIRACVRDSQEREQIAEHDRERVRARVMRAFA